METLNGTIEFKGAQITLEMAKMISYYQQDANYYANFHIESIGDLMVDLIGKTDDLSSNDEKSKILNILNILGAIRDTIKSLRK